MAESMHQPAQWGSPMRTMIVVATAVLATACGAGVCEGNVLLKSARDVEAFAERCRSLDGSVAITASDLETVSVPRLVAVRHLEIANNARLTSVEFPALETVLGGEPCDTCSSGLLVTDNLALVHLGFPVLKTLTEFNGDVWVTQNDSLSSLTFPALESVEASIKLTRNRALVNAAFPVLVSTGAYNDFSENAVLRDLSFPVLVSAGFMPIQGNPALVSVSLPAVKDVFSLDVAANASLTTVSAPSLQKAEWYGLSFKDNPVLESVSLPALEVVGSMLWVSGNAALREVSLPALAAAGDVSIQENQAITSIDLPALRKAWGGGTQVSLRVSQNDSLQTVNLPSLTASSESLGFHLNPRLTALNIPLLTTAGSMNFFQNDALERLSAPALTEFTTNCGGLSVQEPAMKELDLPALATSCYLYVGQTGLAELSLPSLRRSDSFHVVENSAMRSLRLPALTSVQFEFEVRDNPALAQCQVDALLSRVGFTGTPRIEGNDASAQCE